ncbi:PorV/PorQ family protein [bacterium]|nr:PorV/PorQ family protein [bacterium]
MVLSGSVLAKGTTGAQFLKIGVGTRACALGEAYGAIAYDPTAIYWNPAGLNLIEGHSVYFEQNFWLLDMTQQFLGGAFSTKLGNLGFGFYYSSSGEIPIVENFQIVGEYSAYDAAFSIAYSNKAFNLFSYGITGKYIYQKIEEENASSFAADLGFLYKPANLDRFRIGFSIQNLGPEIKFIEEGDPLPLNFRLSTSYLGEVYSFNAQVDKPVDGDISFSAGSENILFDILTVWVGYNTSKSYSLGIGINYWNLGFGYAYVPHDDLDASHRISLEIEF